MNDISKKPGKKWYPAKKPSTAPKSKPSADARAIALAMLGSVIQQKHTLDEALDEAFGYGTAGSLMELRDRGFARLLATTVLRRRGQIDDILRHCLSKPLNETPPKLLNILRLGAVQILFLETAPHAAVNSTVRLAGKHASQRGLINGVLRRLDREGRDWVQDQQASNMDAELNSPAWLWQSWVEAWGEEATRTIARCHAVEADLDISLKPQADAERLAEDLTAAQLPNGSLRRLSGGRIEDLPGYYDGEWWIQDVAATLPAKLLLNSLATGTNSTSGSSDGETKFEILDLCAAPGGKTAQLAAAGHLVTAIDMSGKRLKRLSENMQRLQLEATVTKADVRKWQPKNKVPAVLLDAPCSATGTIRRHPDAAWSKSPAEISRLVKIQQDLVVSAIQMLEPGGVLIYCTCSLQPEEGEARAAEMRDNPDLEHLPVSPAEAVGFEAAINEQGDVRILPGMIAQPQAQALDASPEVDSEVSQETPHEASPEDLDMAADMVMEPQSISGGNDGFFITRFRRK